VASGVSQSEAYRRVSGKTANANNHGDEYMAKHGMKERIEEIRAANTKQVNITREEVLEFLLRIIRAKPSEASFENPHCELTFSRSGKEAVFPSKLSAASQLSKMCGWDAPAKFNLEAGDSLSALLRDIVTK
jgi:terminase small subunit-like protein